MDICLMSNLLILLSTLTPGARISHSQRYDFTERYPKDRRRSPKLAGAVVLHRRRGHHG